MSIPTRKIGNDDVTAVGWGAMGLSTFYGPPPPDEERFKLLDGIYEKGCRNWDTADCYADSEDLLGQWFKRSGKRDGIFLATKGGFIFDANGATFNGSPEYIKKAIESSLKRLGTDRIDLYYLHRPDPNVPIEKSVAAMAELVKEGKVKYIGLSDCNGETLRRAYAVHPISAVEVEYSAFELIVESEAVGLLTAARELGVAVVAYSPLGRGMLSGRFKSPDDFAPDDSRRNFPRFSKENFPNVLKIADGLKKIGERHNATASQVALAWLLGQGNDVIPIPGTTKITTIEENLAALNVKLSAEELQEIRDIAVKSEASNGPRHPDWFTIESFVDTPKL